LWQFNPQQFIQQQVQNIHNIRQRMNVNIKHQFQQAHQKLANTSHNLQTVSPLSTLARGYGIVQRDDRTPITSASNVNKGDKIITRLHQGKLECTVDKITK
jgi:exodeoxyribonuclease VII large subunit